MKDEQKNFNETVIENEELETPSEQLPETAPEQPEMDRSAYNCPSCGGEGLDASQQRCSQCGGTGKV